MHANAGFIARRPINFGVYMHRRALGWAGGGDERKDGGCFISAPIEHVAR